jgi:hypothetical protein
MSAKDEPRRAHRGERPLGHRAYVKIPHLPGSRMNGTDHRAPSELARWCTHEARVGDEVVVQEKLDGSCVAVALKHGAVLALGREGFLAAEGENPGRQMFARWVATNEARFRDVLHEGEWLVGEWLALAHSTRYALTHEPLVVFDLCTPSEKGTQNLGAARFTCWSSTVTGARLGGRFVRPHVVHCGPAVRLEVVDALLGEHGFHGAVDRVEGAMWRVERGDELVLRAKYVRPKKVDGALLPENSGKAAVWNWREST